MRLIKSVYTFSLHFIPYLFKGILFVTILYATFYETRLQD